MSRVIFWIVLLLPMCALAADPPPPAGASDQQVMSALHQQLVGEETLENYAWSRMEQLQAQLAKMQADAAAHAAAPAPAPAPAKPAATRLEHPQQKETPTLPPHH